MVACMYVCMYARRLCIYVCICECLPVCVYPGFQRIDGYRSYVNSLCVLLDTPSKREKKIHHEEMPAVGQLTLYPKEWRLKVYI